MRFYFQKKKAADDGEILSDSEEERPRKKKRGRKGKGGGSGSGSGSGSDDGGRRGRYDIFTIKILNIGTDRFKQTVQALNAFGLCHLKE